jgi:hypothetical protein
MKGFKGGNYLISIDRSENEIVAEGKFSTKLLIAFNRSSIYK